ncbi:uncharacterized protein LOC108894147 [Lates japonicus]
MSLLLALNGIKYFFSSQANPRSGTRGFTTVKTKDKRFSEREMEEQGRALRVGAEICKIIRCDPVHLTLTGTDNLPG